MSYCSQQSKWFCVLEREWTHPDRRLPEFHTFTQNDGSIISSNSERLPDINIYQLKVLDCAMDACINLGLLEEALFYGIRTMEPYR